MKSRHILIVIVILCTVGHTATAQPKKKKIIQIDAPAPESILAGTTTQSNPVLSDLLALTPETPLGPRDVLKSYEIAMSLVADKTSSDFSVIVQAQQANQITRDQAEYLLQQGYQIAMMQYQVLSALHDVLKHDIDQATQQAKSSLNTASSDTVLVVPFPGSTSALR
jgi:ribulose bisphosphate carboxylase small subunit